MIYRKDIDGLRAVAIIAVVVFHAFPARLPGGFVGVDVFFVISGFLITSLILDHLSAGRFSFADFYARRIRRLAPALLLVIAASLFAGTSLMLAYDLEQLGKHAAASILFVTNIVLWKQSGYFDTDAVSKPLMHLWSLGVEEQFYLIWPSLLFVIWHGARRYLLILLSLIVVSSLLASILISYHAPNFAFFWPFTRLWQLGLGALVACTQPRLSGFRSNACAVLGAVAIGASVVLIDANTIYPGFWAIVPTMGAVLLIVAGEQAWFNRVILSKRVMVGIGLISYPLYLWHWPLLSFAHIAEGQTPSVPTRLLLVVLAVALATGTYWFVERPIRQGARFRQFKVAGLCLVGALVGIVGFQFYRDGMVSDYQRIANIRYVENAEAWRGGKCLIGPDNGWPIGESAGIKNFDDCIEHDSRPLLVLWGDSFAAHLYPGLKAMQHTYGYRIAEYTLNRCPSILDYHDPKRTYCADFIPAIFERVISLQPAYLVLSNAWFGYPETDRALAMTLKSLSSRLPDAEITVVGQPPIWAEPLPRILQSLTKIEGGQITKIPDIRISGHLNTLYNDVAAVRRTVEGTALPNVHVFSASAILCDERGCLTREGRDFQNLYSMDAGHLTPPASLLVGRELAPFAVQRKALQ